MSEQAKKQLVPKFRFKEFSGKWEVKTFDEITDKIGDGLHATPIYDETGDYYFINGNNLTDSKISLFENTKKVSAIEFEKHKVNLGNQTILMSINGTIPLSQNSCHLKF
jgi:type I restriction enzyme S subunit